MTTAGGLTVAAMAAVALATAAALPAGRVFGLALAGVAACLAATVYYLAEYPPTRRSARSR